MKLENLMGVELSHDGNTSVDWIITYTEDGETWKTALFDDGEQARAFAFIKRDQNFSNDKFNFVVERTVVLNRQQLMVEGIRLSQVDAAANLWLERQFKK